MKNLVIVLFSSLILMACSNGEKAGNRLPDTETALYERATKLGDDRTAIVALNYILMRDTTNLAYTDSLARLYLRNGVLTPGLKLGEKVMKVQPDNYATLELVAEAHMLLGNLTKATDEFQLLHKKIGDVRYLYKLVKIDYERQDGTALDKRLEQIIIDPQTADVEFPTRQGIQVVDIKAAANLLKAQLHAQMGNLNESMSYVKKAMAIEPNFLPAAELFQDIQVAKKTPNKPNIQQGPTNREVVPDYEEWKKNNSK